MSSTPPEPAAQHAARAAENAEEAKLLAAYRRSSAWHRTVLLGLAVAFGAAEDDQSEQLGDNIVPIRRIF
jgi:hypothetical protein